MPKLQLPNSLFNCSSCFSWPPGYTTGTVPPSIAYSLPWIYAALLDTRKATSLATSSGRPGLGDHRDVAVLMGMVHRTIYPEVPPRVEYRLTDWGQALCPTFDSLLKCDALRDVTLLASDADT